jgi:archaemetzincin
MIKVIILHLTLTILLTSGCQKRSFAGSEIPTIVIQPFEDFNKNQSYYIYNEIKKIYPYVIINKPITLEDKFLNSSKTKYKAYNIITNLQSKAKSNQVFIALTSKDIGVEKNGYKDWGVMGLGFRPGRACIVSTYRIRNDRQKELLKVVIHEFGHTQGLEHCKTKNCVMNDAKGKSLINSKTEFCFNCKRISQNKLL